MAWNRSGSQACRPPVRLPCSSNVAGPMFLSGVHEDLVAARQGKQHVPLHTVTLYVNPFTALGIHPRQHAANLISRFQKALFKNAELLLKLAWQRIKKRCNQDVLVNGHDVAAGILPQLTGRQQPSMYHVPHWVISCYSEYSR